MLRWVLTILSAAAALHLQTPTAEPEPDAPNIIMVGVAGSGTTALTKALEYLGLVQCSVRDIFHEPVQHSDPRYPDRLFMVHRLLRASGGKITEEGYRRDEELFRLGVDFVSHVARSEADCIRKRGKRREPREVAWGWKEPQYIYLMPMVDAAFKGETQIVAVARDPRDACSANFMKLDQYYEYGHFFLNGMPKNCFNWWGELWEHVLDHHEGSPNFHVIRIEDLVLPEPYSPKALSTMRCLLQLSGLQPAFNASGQEGHTMVNVTVKSKAKVVTKQNAVKRLKIFHKRRKSYQGHHRHLTEEKRRELEEAVRNQTMPASLHRAMRRLGYSIDGYGLTEATSPSVCK